MRPSAAPNSPSPTLIHAVGSWASDHLSVDVNFNGPSFGVNTGLNSTGVYGNWTKGPGGIGEASITANVNFGPTPEGDLQEILSGAITTDPSGFPTGRFSFGHSDAGWYFNVGIGWGYAAYLGGGVGDGLYLYRFPDSSGH
jgi:hypothetical protein